MQRCSGELQTAGALGGTGIEASIDHGEASGRWVEPGKAALLFVSTAIAVGAAFGLSAGLGRILDERSFAGFTVLLAVALAAPLTWLVAVGEARPRWWVAIGLACLIALQVADVVAAWWVHPVDEGSYAAASSLARLVFLLEVVAVAGSRFTEQDRRVGLRGLAIRSIPAALVVVAAEAVPSRLVELAYGRSYPAAAGYLRLLAPAMLLAGGALVLIQLLLHAGRISWVSWVASAAIVAAPLVGLGAVAPMSLAALVLAVNAVVLMALAAHASRLLFARQRDGSVLFLAWRDRRHPEGGGSEVYVEEIAGRLAASGRRVTIFCAGHRLAPRTEVVDGVRFIRRGGRFTVYAWAALYHLAGRLRDHDIVVDVQNGVPFFSPLYCSRPVVVLVHHVHREQWPVVFSRRAARLGWWVESRLAPLLYVRASYVAVSDATRSELVGLGIDPERISVVHNGVDPQVPAGRLEKTAQPTVAYLGRLVPHKRVELLLEAMVRIGSDLPGSTLSIAGRGWWEARLRDRAEQLGLEDRVRFLGWIDERQKAELVGRSWVLAMPSMKEGWGLAVLEAATAGTPAVGFRTGGLAESIVDGVTGLVADDAEGFTEALERILRDADLREALGRRAEARSRDFDWDSSARSFGRILNGIVEVPAAEIVAGAVAEPA